MTISKGTALTLRLRSLGRAKKAIIGLRLKKPDEMALTRLLENLPKRGVKAIFITGGALRHAFKQQKSYRDVDLIPIVTNKQTRHQLESLFPTKSTAPTRRIEFPEILSTKHLSQKELKKELARCRNNELDHLFMPLYGIPIYEKDKGGGAHIKQAIHTALLNELGEKEFQRRYLDWRRRMLQAATRRHHKNKRLTRCGLSAP